MIAFTRVRYTPSTDGKDTNDKKVANLVHKYNGIGSFNLYDEFSGLVTACFYFFTMKSAIKTNDKLHNLKCVKSAVITSTLQ
jgi:hypothetical protein